MYSEILKIIERLDRIVSLLEEDLNARSKRDTVPARTPKAPSSGAKALIATYCEAYKGRHGSYPIIDGKAAGTARNLLRALPLERAQDLVQAYLQMDTPWFKTRGWSLDTLTSNLNTVALALANGTKEPGEKAYWEKVFGGDAKHDEGSISEGDREAQGNLLGAVLPSRESSPPMASISIGRRG